MNNGGENWDNWDEFDDPAKSYEQIGNDEDAFATFDDNKKKPKKKKNKKKNKNKPPNSDIVTGVQGLQIHEDIDQAEMFISQIGLTAAQYSQLQREQQLAMQQLKQQKEKSAGAKQHDNDPFTDFGGMQGEHQKSSDNWEPFTADPQSQPTTQMQSQSTQQSQPFEAGFSTSETHDFFSSNANDDIFNNGSQPIRQQTWESFETDHTSEFISQPSQTDTFDNGSKDDNWSGFSENGIENVQNRKPLKSDEMKSDSSPHFTDKLSVSKRLMEWFLSQNCGMPQYINTFVTHQSLDIRLLSHIDESILKQFDVKPLHCRRILECIAQFNSDAELFRIFMEGCVDPPLFGFWKELHRKGVLTWDCLSIVATDISDIVRLVGDGVAIDNPSIVFINTHLQTFKRTRVFPKLDNNDNRPNRAIKNDEMECEGAVATAADDTAYLM